jgi:hypothetical protein
MAEYVTAQLPGTSGASVTNVPTYGVMYFLVVTGTVTTVVLNTTAERTIATCTLPIPVNGAVVKVTKPTLQAGLGIVNARIDTSGNLIICYANLTGSSIQPTNETYAVEVTYL